MQQALDRFLRYLTVERNASPLTVKSYREDLTSLAEYLRADSGDCPPVGKLTTLDLREFLAALHEAGYAKTSIARRLSLSAQFFSLCPARGDD